MIKNKQLVNMRQQTIHLYKNTQNKRSDKNWVQLSNNNDKEGQQSRSII